MVGKEEDGIQQTGDRIRNIGILEEGEAAPTRQRLVKGDQG
jgi:hypothetical protein